MKINLRFILLSWISILILQNLTAQTSWKGITSTNWRTASNWTNGVPTSTVDAIIGDSSFTGSFQPTLTNTSACKNLIIGNGTVSSTLTIARSITVAGNVLIGANGTISANTASRTITIKGNWTNSGTYSATKTTAKVTFSGVTQSLAGVTSFQSLTINSGSTVTLAGNISVVYAFSVSGTMDPALNTISGAGTMAIGSTGTLIVNTTNFSGNYTISGTATLNATSTVNYASASLPQNVSSTYTYGKLRISGGSTKSLTANLPGLNATISTAGNIYVDAGVFDLKTFTANRNATGGGTIALAAGTQLRIGGTNSFPSNYTTLTIASTSTVEYYGNNQTVIATTYGNLILSGTAGSVVKTMPATALTIAGDFTSTLGTATSVSYTASQAITVNKDVTIGASCTFNGGSYAHIFRTNWVNNGTFTGSTSTVTFNGVGSNLGGTGTNNFNNLSITAAGITGNSTTGISVLGNLATTAPGVFTHAAGGTVTMTGASKTITGTGFEFSNLVISGTASITTNTNILVTGNFTNNGTFAASAGTITMSGSSTAINGSGTATIYSLSITGTVSTAVSFNMLSNLSVAIGASFTASAGTATFNGTSTLSGTANLSSVTINSTRSLLLGSSSILGISGTFTKTGTLDVTSVTPNTVNYNGSGIQTIIGTSYFNLVLSNGGTKTPSAAVNVNNDFTVNSGVTFNASSYVFSLYRHWTNLGTFTASTSDIQLRGVNAATLTGVSTFSTLTVNKSSAGVKVTLANNMIASNVVMTSGNMATGAYSITVTTTRSGPGIIIGTVIHSHTFTNGTTYYFEGPNNGITFTNPSGISSVTVTSKIGEIVDFNPAMESVTREYQISMSSGTYTSVNLRLHYENNELNAFAEPFLSIYKFNSGIVWDSIGFTARDTGANYVEKSGILSLPGRYTESGVRNVVRWNGSVSSAWNNASNWTTISGSSMANRVPTSTDAAELGAVTFTNQPTVTTTQQVSVLRFGSVQSATLTISGGALASFGSIRGQWSTSRSHILDVSSGSLTAGTNILLSDDTSGHDIMLRIGSGTANVTYNLKQSATGAVNFTGSGSLVISGNYNYTGGSFTGGTGTVTYSGGESQVVANVIYNNLTFSKSTERATFSLPTTVNGNLTTTTGGEIAVFDTLKIGGNMTIGASTYLYNEASVLRVGGNWLNNGNYISTNGTAWFNGTGSQTVNTNTFGNLVVSKSSGTLTPTGNLVVNANLSILSGTFDLDTFKVNRFTEGGIFNMATGSTLKVKGANNFPQNYISNTLHASSTVNYYGSVAQNVASSITYGNLTFTNGGTMVKSLSGNIRVNGDMLISSGSTFSPGIHSVNLFGNLTNSGTFTPGTSTTLLNGSSKTITGTTTFNDLTLVTGSYTVPSGTISMSGDLYIESTGSLNFGNNNASLDGDLTNKGTLISNGTSTFTGTRVQTIQLVNAITSSSTGIINFNGTVSPIINSSSSPSYATVNINNTGGITASVPWNVFVAMNIASGATFNAGPLTHSFYGNLTNNGTLSSSGKLKFTPGSPYSSSATIRLDGIAFTSTGEIEFGGTAPITILQVNPTLNVVDISNTHTAGISAPGNWAIADELRVQSGALFNAGSYNHLITGSILNNGIFDGQTSTIRFDGSASEINGTSTCTFNNLKIESAGDLTLNRSINVKQNFILDGTFNGDGRTVRFTGTGASIISGTAGSVTFGDVEMLKTGANTTLSIPATVEGDLTMTTGNIVTTATNLLIVADGGTATAGSDNSYVSGPMKKIGNEAFVFPVGKGGKWARLGIGAPSLTTDEFVAEYFNFPYSNTSSMATSPTPVLTDVSVIEYWICNRVAGSSNVTVKLYWENSLSGIRTYNNDLVVARWNGSAWENKGQSAITGSTPGDVTSNTVTSFSPFTFGSLSLALNLLPVKLLSFEGELNPKKEVDLTWKTSTEINNDYFTIERSADGKFFEPLFTVDGAGNSTRVIDYAGKDPHPLKGISYYRLKQTDYNGKSEYSQILVIVNNELSVNDIIAYPNPVNDELHLKTDPSLQGQVTVRNLVGAVVYLGSIAGPDFRMDVSDLQRGVYIITVDSGTRNFQIKFTKL
jgi:fibronectin-binding autotransporter adhesin